MVFHVNIDNFATFSAQLKCYICDFIFRDIIICKCPTYRFAFCPVGCGCRSCFSFLAVGFIYIKSKKLKLSRIEINAINTLAIIVLLQVVLGVFTLIYGVPIWLGIIHQIGAFLLLGSTVFALFTAPALSVTRRRDVDAVHGYLQDGLQLFGAFGQGLRLEEKLFLLGFHGAAHCRSGYQNQIWHFV